MKIIAADALPTNAEDQKALQIANDANLAELVAGGALQGVARVELHFPKWTDGRAYSQARLLRRRYRFAGDLRATGDVIFPVSAAIASIVLVLGFGSLVLGRQWGLAGIWIAYAADEWIRSAIMFWRWETRGWVRHAQAIHQRIREPGIESRF